MTDLTSVPADRSFDPVPVLDLAAQRRRLDGRIERAIERVMAHGRFILGPEVEQLETRLADFCGAEHVVSCASGTDGLLLALLAWNVGPGDAVFVPAFTFAASAEVVALVGAMPVFVDVQADTFNLDPTSLKDAIASLDGSDLVPRGVVAVDLFGQPADYDAIDAVAQEAGLWVLGDAAQSFGAALHGQPVGSLADMTVTSFFPTKPLGCYGDGGAVIASSAEQADVLRSLRVHGEGRTRYDHVRIGINGRLDTIQAAVLLEKLTIFADEIRAREQVATRYSAELADVVRVPEVRPGVRSAWAQYTIQVEDRTEVARRLQAQAIPTAVYYPTPVHRQPAFERYPTAPGRLLVSDALAASVLSLPMHAYLSDKQQDRVIAAVRSAAN